MDTQDAPATAPGQALEPELDMQWLPGGGFAHREQRDLGVTLAGERCRLAHPGPERLEEMAQEARLCGSAAALEGVVRGHMFARQGGLLTELDVRVVERRLAAGDRVTVGHLLAAHRAALGLWRAT